MHALKNIIATINEHLEKIKFDNWKCAKQWNTVDFDTVLLYF